MNKSNNQTKANKSKILVKVHKNDVDSNDSFFVPITRFAKVRKLQRKIKALTGVRVVDQILLSLPSRRELKVDESLHSLLTADQDEVNLCLVVNPAGQNDSKEATLETTTDICQATSSVPSTLVDEFNSKLTLIESVVPEQQQQQQLSKLLVTAIKLSFQEQHRRFLFEHAAGNASFSALAGVCTQFFGYKNIHRMIISYQDEDGDFVQVSSDSELTYALKNYAVQSSVHQGLSVLKLRFNVKPIKKQEEDEGEVNNVSVSEVSQSSGERKLKTGDSIVLQTQRDGGVVLNLAFSLEHKKVFAARHFSGNNLVRKNAQWLVEKLPEASAQTGEEIFVLTNKALNTQRQQNGKPKKNLRILPNGRVNHQGAKGMWARFVVVAKADGQVSLRSVGRSVRHPDNNFLGIVKNSRTNNMDQSVPEFSVAGDLHGNSEDAKFTLHFA